MFQREQVSRLFVCTKIVQFDSQATKWSCKNTNIALILLLISSSTPVLLDTLRQLSNSLSSDVQVIRVLCRLLVILPQFSNNLNVDVPRPQLNSLTVLIRTVQRDTKMMIPPSKQLEKFDLDIPSILKGTYLSQGEVSVLWGNYESWECLISLASCPLELEDARETINRLQTCESIINCVNLSP
tara:strand:- start:637 stop:1188 length:552 start_codon:yes stop_codon:yes gene_type:complete